MDTPTILLTGSGRGIGAAVAGALRARGACVIGHAARVVDADTIAADVGECGAPPASVGAGAGGRIFRWARPI